MVGTVSFDELSPESYSDISDMNTLFPPTLLKNYHQHQTHPHHDDHLAVSIRRNPGRKLPAFTPLSSLTIKKNQSLTPAPFQTSTLSLGRKQCHTKFNHFSTTTPGRWQSYPLVAQPLVADGLIESNDLPTDPSKDTNLVSWQKGSLRDRGSITTKHILLSSNLTHFASSYPWPPVVISH